MVLALSGPSPARAECALDSQGREKCYPEFADVPSATAEPVSNAESADIRLTPDRSEIIRLSQEVGSVVIGNPQTLSVFVDTPQSLVLVPKTAGATYFTVLDKTGNVIMERHVIVAAPKRGYVRIRTGCMGKESDSCNPTRMYYCPQGSMCHDVPMASDAGKSQDKTAKELGKLMMKSIEDDTATQTPSPESTDQDAETAQ